VSATSPLGLDQDAAGVFFRAIDLYLDPIAAGAPGSGAFVSHVHAVVTYESGWAGAAFDPRGAS
jgi:hypothetical protein